MAVAGAGPGAKVVARSEAGTRAVAKFWSEIVVGARAETGPRGVVEPVAEAEALALALALA